MTHTNLFVRLAVALCLLVSADLFSATHTVCASGCDFSSVQSAINDAGTMSGDVIRITDATFTELSITVNKSGLTIEGTGQNTTVLQAAASQGAAADRIFTVNASITVTIQDMTIRYGNSTGRGGAMLMNSSCSITMNRVTLTNNDSASDGGAIASAGSTSGITLIMDDCVVAHNNGGLSDTSADGGGIYQAGGNLTMTTCTVIYNKAGDDGGGIYLNENGSSNSLTNCTISNNICGEAGAAANTIDGGGMMLDDGTTTLINCTIAANTSPGFAGGIGIPFGSVHMTNNIFADNSSVFAANDVCLEGTVGTNNNNLAESCHGSECPTWAVTSDPGLTGLTRCSGKNHYTHGISMGSSAQDAGTTTGAPSNDICGTMRGTPPDLGSFEIGSVLPVSLTFFRGKLDEKTIELKWETAFEKNNAGFDIERSYDGIRFENIGTIYGAGDSFNRVQYDFSDNDFDKNRTHIYYRLKQTDFDGNYLYSNTVIVKTTGNNYLTINYIYSDSETAFVTFSNQTDGEISVRLFDFSGKNVLNQTYFPTVGTNVLELNIGDLPTGIYGLQIQSGGVRIAEKVVKQH